MSTYVKNYLIAGVLMLCAATGVAQDSTQKVITKKEKKKQEEARKLSQLKQEEEGVLVFSRHTVGGLQLRTNGYGAFVEIGRSRTPRFTNLFMFEFTEIKHAKEEKVQTTNIFSNAFVYGKINNFYQAKLGFGQQYVFGQKGNKNGVAVLATAHAGLSMGLLKPYYVNVDDPSSGPRDVKYESEDSLLFLGSNGFNGGSGFTKGWGELKIRPGVFVKTGLRFDFNRFNETIQALEIGMSVDFYPKAVEQLAYVEPNRLFFQGHIAFVFGRRK